MKNVRIAPFVLGVIVIALLISIAPTPKAEAGLDCFMHQNSRSVPWPGYGTVCAYTGPGCLECIVTPINPPVD